MLTKQLGNTDLELTRVGLGTWAIGGPWQYGWGPQRDEDSKKAIREALDNGINWIDTAWAYGCGHSEEVIGEVLKEISEKPIIATKCGLICDENKERKMSLSADSIMRQCEQSLTRLGTETIDLYQMHWPEPDHMIEEAYEAMTKCVEQGKVRYLGVSNFSPEQMDRVNRIHPLSSLQPVYNILSREIEEETLPYCGQNNIGVICYSPMEKGLLTGKYGKDALEKISDDDVRQTDPNFQEPKLSAHLKLLDGLKEIADRNNKTLPQLAIAWVLRREEVTSAIVGARKPGQISETAEAGDWILSDEDSAEIEKIMERVYG